MIAELLKKYAKDKMSSRPPHPKEKHWPSDAAKCLRALVYQWRGEKALPTNPRLFFIFADGDMHHKAIVQQLSDAGVEVTMREAPLRDPKLNISGKLDALIKLDGRYYVLEIKSINRWGFEEVIRDGPKEEHVIQLQLYLYFVQNIFRIEAKSGILLYKNKDTSSFYDFDIPFDERVVNDFLDRLKQVESYIANNTLPDRPYPRTDWHCNYCDYREVCWLGVPEKGTVEITDEELVRAISELIFVKGQRKEFETKEDDLIEIVKEQLRKKQITEARLGSYMINLKESSMRRLDQNKLKEFLKEKLDEFYSETKMERLDIKEDPDL
ncbi:MAG: CRISPR-associated protein Cas4 [Candidatus Brocadiia bacterium]